MPDTNLEVREQIFHSIRSLTRWTIVLFLSVILVSGIGFWDSLQRRQELTHIADQTLGALCTFRADLQNRYDSGLKFLEDNPDGIPGLSAETIQQSLDNQARTLHSLAGLPCGATK